MRFLLHFLAFDNFNIYSQESNLFPLERFFQRLSLIFMFTGDSVLSILLNGLELFCYK